jgi:hypothetical protein
VFLLLVVELVEQMKAMTMGQEEREKRQEQERKEERKRQEERAKVSIFEAGLVKRALEVFSQEKTISASEASNNKEATDDMLAQLNLNTEPDVIKTEYTIPSADKDQFGEKWMWSWKFEAKGEAGGDKTSPSEKDEKAAYGPLAAHIKKLGLVCFDVSNGQGSVPFPSGEGSVLGYFECFPQRSFDS